MVNTLPRERIAILIEKPSYQPQPPFLLLSFLTPKQIDWSAHTTSILVAHQSYRVQRKCHIIFFLYSCQASNSYVVSHCVSRSIVVSVQRSLKLVSLSLLKKKKRLLVIICSGYQSQRGVNGTQKFLPQIFPAFLEMLNKIEKLEN